MPISRPAEEIDGKEKATGRVRLDGGNYGKLAFRARSNHQNLAVRPLRRKKIILAAMQFGYNLREFGGYPGNVG